jgi:hypothetical protein
MTSSPSARFSGVALLALTFAACGATTLDATWVRPGFAGNHIEGKVLVVGVSRDNAVRRIYEDDMVQKLGARGVTAVRSYESLPDLLDKDATGRVMAAGSQAGARYLLSTALVGREVEQVATTDPGYGGYHRWYSDNYDLSLTDTTEVHTYDVFILQTSLTDVAADRVEWTARTRTVAPKDIQKEMHAFVDIILGALAKSQLIGASK